MRGDASVALDVRIAPDDFTWALGSLCNLHRLAYDAALITHAYPPPHTTGTLVAALRGLQCAAELISCPLHRLATIAMPCVAVVAIGGAGEEPKAMRPVLVVRADADRVLYFAAQENAPTIAALDAFAARYMGIVVKVLRPLGSTVPDEADAPPRFGFRWFLPELLRHRQVWREVLAASLVLQVLALTLPLLSQVVIDKVVVHQSTSTLALIAFALVTVVIFSSAISWVRQYLVIHTGNRVDAVLGTTVFRHLLALPVRYFERRPTGVLTARLAGIETIREFLTGAAVTLALDVPFLLVFVAIMAAYSVPLTLLTLAVVVLIAAASAIAAPMLQRRYDAQFLASAKTQAFVTEHIAAMDTVKSLQLEPILGVRYETLLAQYLESSFRTRQVANSYQTATSTLEQLLSAGILCLGAWIVMTTPTFTIGMLVAFQMFATRVSQPLLRLTGLWQQFQQAAIAVKRLADVMDVPGEARSLAALREVRGHSGVEFASVGFRHGADRPWLHRDLSFVIQPGECVVITGPSGCGKSTLLRMMLGFLYPEEGAVRVDGRDTRAYPVNELRARFGVVPQETVLFAGTVLDNLHLGNPLVPFEQVLQACRLAGIHSTIESLPEGYRTEVGERGVGLSGGQKQRLSLARALLRRPAILLLDEPFSQLDDETAATIAAAVSRLKGALTIVIVSHHVPAALTFDRMLALAGDDRARRRSVASQSDIAATAGEPIRTGPPRDAR